MNTLGLTYEQNSVVDAVLTLINNMDDKMRNVLFKKLRSNKEKAITKKVVNSKSHKWMDYPVSDEVMSMTFKDRKPIDENYKGILENELKKKYL